MKFLLDLLPVVAFFIGYRAGITLPQLHLNQPIEFATALAIVLSVAQIVWLKLRKRPVDLLQWISLGIICILGGATILLHNQHFIFWKPTALYWVAAIALTVTRYAYGRSPMKSLLGKEIHLEDAIWDALMWIWVIFFALMGVANLYVAFNYAEGTWVNYKLACVVGITPVFVLAQAAWLAQHMKSTDSNQSSEAASPAPPVNLKE